MSVTNGERLVTKQDLADMYQGILPYLGGMPEVLANKFSKGDLYSTEEKMIGQWIDGKPLYQKVITNLSYTPTANNWSNTGVNIPNCERIISCGFGQNDTSFIYIALCKCNSNGDLEAWFSSYIYGYQTMLVQYTKTTDSAISIGSDTDYSTEEKIVGTWIDGKPIYQKSYVVQNQVSISENTWNTILSSVGFISVLIDVNINGTKISNPYAFRKNNSNIECYLAGVSDTIYSNDVITIRYTKTT